MSLMSSTSLNSLEPWIENLLSDVDSQSPITDLCIQPEQEISTWSDSNVLRVYADQGSGTQPVSGHVSLTWAQNWILSELSKARKTWDAKYPFADFRLKTGWRVHVAFQPASPNGPSISIRKNGSSKNRTERSWNPISGYELLRQAAQRSETILLAGSTGSGKTTLLTDLLSELPPHERVIALEDTPEIWPHHPHFLGLQSRPPNADGYGEITLRHLLRESLRMRPDRIVLGECRGAEVLDLLQTLNTGHRGSLATIHANSARDALKRVELLCYLHFKNSPPTSVIRDLIANGIQWVAHLEREGPSRVIKEVLRIEGREGDTILTRSLVGANVATTSRGPGLAEFYKC
jgi:pilus assembly protein CpaF